MRVPELFIYCNCLDFSDFLCDVSANELLLQQSTTGHGKSAYSNAR
jgi:hypothetical protein